MMLPKSIAIRLSLQQTRLIRSMTAEPCVLGCAEVTAIPLSKPSRGGLRPALVVRSKTADGIPCFALNERGLQVKAALEELA